MEDDIYIRNRNQRQINSTINDKEGENLHNSYSFELEMYQYIKTEM